MTDALAPSPAAPASPPSGADPGAAPASSPIGAAPAAPTALAKPEFLPAEFWDDKAGIKTDEFGKSYTADVADAAKYRERIADVPKDISGYNPEVKLPETIKVPEGITFDPSKDQRTPMLLAVAHERGWSNGDVNAIVALDAQIAIENHAAEQTRVADETKKLGEKATDRIAAVTNWAKGLKDKNDITTDEHAEIRFIASTAAGVSLLEKFMAKANGGIPGHVPTPPAPQRELTVAERLYPHLPSGLPPVSRSA